MSKITGQTAWLLRRLRAFKVQADLDRLFLYNTIQAARIAMDTEEAPRKHPAVEERAKFALHELRNIPIMLALPGQKRFQISGNDAVERILLGIARPVDIFECHRDVCACKRQRIRQLAKTMTCMVRPSRIPAGSRLKSRVCLEFSDFWGVQRVQF